METILRNLAQKINIDLTEEQIDKFMMYKNLLIETNRFVNLTSIVDDREIILKHFVDSLTINKYIEKNKTLIDVGTGAGFPGIPIRIIRDDVKVTLLDSLNKRLNFISSVLIETKINDVELIHGRAEDIARIPKYREMYDYVTARAVANLATLAELCIPFLKVGGQFICMKSSIEEELEKSKNAISTLGGEIVSIDNFVLPNSDIERNIIIIKKIKSTDNRFPRKAGKPDKQPLK